MSEIDVYDNYYERFHSFKKKLTSEEENRIKNTIDLIPKDVNSLLEVGCGDGRIINLLKGRYDNICGLDISHEALKYVETPKVQGRLEKLPFPDNYFEMIICCEVLEHLPYSVYGKAIQEMERVSTKYILISVPNNENLDFGMVKCPKCSCSFHIWRHLRSYNFNKLKEIFKSFKLIEIKKYYSSKQPIYLNTNTIFKIKRCLKKNQMIKENYICPQCGYYPKFKKESESTNLKIQNPIDNLLKKIIPQKNAGGWIITLYKCSNL